MPKSVCVCVCVCVGCVSTVNGGHGHVEKKITCTGFGPLFSTEKAYTSCASAILLTKCSTIEELISKTC